jgi:HAD superfamily hydrolase (TIGR01662 family)
MAQAVMIVGYPAAGKTSLVKELEDQGHVRLNRDDMGGKLTTLVRPMQKHLQDGKSVVLDNTFPTTQSRQPFIDACFRSKHKIRCIHLDTSIEDAQFNACMRMMERYNRILMPEEVKMAKHPNTFPPAVLFKFRKEFEKPTTDEGFAAVDTKSFKRKEKGYTNKALILDYDGTLRETAGGGKWPVKPSEVRILPGRKEKLQEYVDQGYILLGISNQSGIAKGNPTDQGAKHCFDRTNELLGFEIEYLYCPHRVPPVTCFCRKPMPGLGVQFIEKHKLDRSQTIYVGDQTSDKTFAGRCGFKYIDQKKFFK